MGFSFRENSSGFCKSVWLLGSILNFCIGSVSSIEGLIAPTLFAVTISDSPSCVLLHVEKAICAKAWGNSKLWGLSSGGLTYKATLCNSCTIVCYCAHLWPFTQKNPFRPCCKRNFRRNMTKLWTIEDKYPRPPFESPHLDFTESSCCCCWGRGGGQVMSFGQRVVDILDWHQNLIGLVLLERFPKLLWGSQAPNIINKWDHFIGTVQLPSPIHRVTAT